MVQRRLAWVRMNRLPPFRVTPAPRPAAGENAQADSLADWCREYHFAIREIERFLHGLEPVVTETEIDPESLRGPQGPEGPQGFPGEPGVNGTTPTTAENGNNGLAGTDGARWYELLGALGGWPPEATSSDLFLFRSFGFVVRLSGYLADLSGPPGTDAGVVACVRSIIPSGGITVGLTDYVPFSSVESQSAHNFNGSVPQRIGAPLAGVYHVGFNLSGNTTDQYIQLLLLAADAAGGTNTRIVTSGVVGASSTQQWMNRSGLVKVPAGGQFWVQCTWSSSIPGVSPLGFDQKSRFWAVYLGA